jgi:alpha-tubulin suppressor-like RCC1 family protein
VAVPGSQYGPALITSLQNSADIVGVSAGFEHSLFLYKNGTVFVVGRNSVSTIFFDN